MKCALLITTLAAARLLYVARAKDLPEQSPGGPPLASSLRTIGNIMLKVYRSCADKEAIGCIRKKTLFLIGILSKEKSFSIINDTLLLVKEPEANETSADFGERSLVDSVTKFINSYRLQLKFPKFTFLKAIQEGRKKNKGYGGLGLIMGGSMLAMMMAALAALSGKALAASMAALMMAAMAALRKGGGGGGGHHSSYDVITVPTHHHRSFYDSEELKGYYEAPYKYEHEHIHTTADHLPEQFQERDHVLHDPRDHHLH